MVTGKSDGVRYFLLAHRDAQGRNCVVLVNRAFEATLIGGIHLPSDLFNGTVMDGELVVDDERKTACFLVFDTLVIRGE